ncbi:LysR family transcriptional regulator [Rhodoferax saidenbachensis]|uniref:LysR family transcriptional regulator n=1 Tax=Rhodoferax saidenbachensis TaxID=1484693 RepID=A0A1P8KCL4_9BURK|nr:LysR family transcriptional regulator [Rhodoferax saidenbachensis]APW43770.1 LysR family transcriptional regulator [Rhodoferax saidenbachensis]
MDFVDLRCFQAVVQYGGITRAAEALHRVPSNVSTRIRMLEENLQAKLFVREGKRMQLSPQGKVLLDYANRLLQLAQEARGALHDGAPRGILRLGAMESTAAIRLPTLLAQMHQQFPALAVELSTGAPRPLTARVIAGELDAALVSEPVSDPRLSSQLAYVESLVMITPAGHPAVRSARDLQLDTLLVFDPDCPHRQRLEAWCAKGKVAPGKVIELGSYHAILGCCVAGMGVALIPAAVLETYTERKHLSVYPLTGDARTMKIKLIWRKDAPQPKIHALAQLLAGKTDRITRSQTGGVQTH